MSTMSLQDLVGIIAAFLSIGVTVGAIAGAMRAGVLKRVKFGSIELEAPSEVVAHVRDLVKTSAATTKEVPFEIEQLANYYSQTLSQSKVSFWFSLIFASLGFAIIVIAAFLYTDGSGTATTAQFVAGLIMDAVAGLFFVQSKSAQKSMADFFDKLRNDRMHVESRNLCDSISNENLKDDLKVRLALHYAGVENAESIATQVISGT